MQISIIAAMADNRVIGIDNTLPWKLPADMKWFRQHTLGKPVLMGRKTFDSIGKALPNRTNLIVTHDRTFSAPGCIICYEIDEALQQMADVDEVMIIGGASFYEQLLPRADRLYLTQIHAAIDGDAYFPEFDATMWREVKRIDCAADEKNAYPYSFIILEHR